MTGEITLTGRVLPIGGLKEKTMAAYKNGISTVIIPERNLPDLKDIDKTVYNAIDFVAVSTVDEVFSAALEFVTKHTEDDRPSAIIEKEKTTRKTSVVVN